MVKNLKKAYTKATEALCSLSEVVEHRLKRAPYPQKDYKRLLQAVELSRKCAASMHAFSVGALIFDAHGRFVSSGYSRETDSHAHAEEVALEKARRRGVNFKGAVELFSSLEPCSIRLSQRPSCVDLIVAAGIKRVVFALEEPLVFVDGKGKERLEASGVEIVVVPTLAPAVREINKHLLA